MCDELNCNSLSDPCVYITKDLIVLVYVEDCILIPKEQAAIATVVQSLRDGPEDLVFTDIGKQKWFEILKTRVIQFYNKELVKIKKELQTW